MSFRLTETIASRVSINSSTLNFTIDLNGQTLSGEDSSAIHHNGSGTLTIKDGSIGKNGKITCSGSGSTIQAYSTAVFEITGGTVENTATGNAVYNGGTSKTVISSGSPVIRSNGGAMNQAPELSGVSAKASINYSGTPIIAYNISV